MLPALFDLSAALQVNPLRYGSGVKSTTRQSIAYGLTFIRGQGLTVILLLKQSILWSIARRFHSIPSGFAYTAMLNRVGFVLCLGPNPLALLPALFKRR